MACNLTTGFLTDCLEGVGGAKEVLLANWDAFETGVTYDGTTGMIDALPEATVYRYLPLRGSLSFTQDATNSVENGTSYIAQNITFKLSGLSAAKRKEFDTLRKAKMAVFVRTAQDLIVFLGRTEGAFVTVLKEATGAAKGDMSGYEVTLVAEELEYGRYLEPYTTNPFDNFVDITVSPAY